MTPHSQLIRQCDKLFAEFILLIRGPNCEVHNSTFCDRIGTAHLLSKAAHPRLRFCPANVIRACWFKSHYFTHHDSSDPRAQRFYEAAARKKGFKDFESLKDYLKTVEITQDRHSTLYLEALKMDLQKKIKDMKKNRFGRTKGTPCAPST